MSLLARLYILVLIALAPALAILWHQEVTLRRSSEAQVHAEALRLTEFATAEVARVIDSARVVLDTVARLPTETPEERRLCSGLVRDILDTGGVIAWLTVMDDEGGVECAGRPVPNPVDIAERPHLVEARRTGGFVVGEHVRSFTTGEVVIPVAVRVTRPNGRVVLAVAGLSVEQLGRDFLSRELPPNGSIAIIDKGGTLLLRHPVDGEQTPPSRIPPAYEWMLTASKAGTMEGTGSDGIERIAGYVPPAQGGGLLVAVGLSKRAALADVDAATRTNIQILAGGLAVALLLAGFGGAMFIRRPVDHLLEIMERWRRGDVSARTGMRGNAEAARLGQAFDEMADAIVARDLARDAAQAALRRSEERLRATLEERDTLMRELNHRVKNNFAVVASLLTLQAGRQAMPEVRHELEKARRRILSIGSLHELLYRGPHTGDIDFAQYLQEIGTLVRGSLVDADAPVSLRVEAEPARIPIDQAIPLGLLVNELATNAVKHAFAPGTGGTVRILFRATPTGHHLTVEDDGRGLPAGYDQTGDRTGEPADGQPRGRGIGLQLAASLARQAGGRLSVGPKSDGNGARFDIDLPTATPNRAAPAA
ncbi:MAG TPA: histidine kinase dimerization/phosphoacceptor domain -containing protein [Azospirillaceae bacterium]|nr:histidine kinase dimerization/phosphoacceptor domain -containing protein [Azospirillaceae bacterium]